MDLSAAVAKFTILAFSGLIIAAAASDWRSLVIPNRYSLALVALYPSYVLASGGTIDWVAGLAFGASAFAAGFVLFAFKIFGGGDVKLFAAIALWAGPTFFVPLTFYTAVGGGIIAVGFWVYRKIDRITVPAALIYGGESTAVSNEPIPYAVAIAAGGLYVAFQLFMGV